MISSCVPEISPKTRIMIFKITRVVVAIGKLDMFMTIVCSLVDINGYADFNVKL
jgi:hypothetical protein